MDGTMNEKRLGEVAYFDLDMSDEEADRWSRTLAALPTCTTTFWSKPLWWGTNKLYKAFGLEAPYTVRRLKRNGKSHKTRSGK